VRAARLGALLLLVRPLYVLSEVIVAAAVGGYSFLDDTVSALGVVGCPVAATVAPGCSPRHAVMNASFVGYGVLLAVGALLLARRWGTSRSGSLAVALLVVGGLGSVATGLAPLDQGSGTHLLAALPVFVAQPAGLLLLAVHLRGIHPGLALGVGAAGVLCVAGAIGFGLLLDAERWSGLAERAALWPVLVAVAAAAAVELRRPAPG
jgi:hypothetical membrane protein